MSDRGHPSELRSPSSVRREHADLQGKRRLADSNCWNQSKRDVHVNASQRVAGRVREPEAVSPHKERAS